MRLFSIAIPTLCSTMLLGSLCPGARADEWNKKTIVTINQSVEVPGHVLLPGTYVFRLLNSESDRNIVVIDSKTGEHVHLILMTEPAERLEATGDTVITFENRGPDTPEAIQDWYYPGDLIGQRFFYPSTASPELAQKEGNVPQMVHGTGK